MKKPVKTKKECVIKKFFKTKKNLPMIGIGGLILAFAIYALVAPTAFKGISDSMFGSTMNLRSHNTVTTSYTYDKVEIECVSDGYHVQTASCSSEMNEVDRAIESLEECKYVGGVETIHFDIDDRCEMEADLVITDVSFGTEIVDIFGSSEFIKPVLKFEITIKNQGNADAISSYDDIGLWIKVNGNDYGRESIDFEDGLGINEEIVIEFEYADDNNNRFLHSTGNIISFYIDKTSTDATFNGIGFVEESNENNNEFIREIHVEGCSDSEQGTSGNTQGELELYGEEIEDSCSNNGNILEYRCEDDFVLGYGYRDCDDGCSNGACTVPNNDPELIEISTKSKLRK